MRAYAVYESGKCIGLVGSDIYLKDSKPIIIRTTKQFLSYRLPTILKDEWKQEIEKLGYRVEFTPDFNLDILNR